MNEELQLLKVLEGACALARKNGTAATARVALRYEERFMKEREKLEAKQAEDAQASARQVQAA